MSTQTKSKFFLLIIGILLLTNIAMLYFLFNKGDGKKPQFDRTGAAKEFLQKEIGFTPQQLQQYDTLDKQHREKVRTMMDEIRAAKEEQRKELGRLGFSDTAINAAILQSSQKQQAMERQFYTYTIELRKICTAAQLPKFDSLFYKMWSRKPKNADEKK